jgi:Lrp/AsnC family transcriptional regulator, leucine-responsive regulatory protein
MRNGVVSELSVANHRRIEGIELDESDRRLIAALDRNARTSTADLAKLIGLSPQSTSDRVKRLEDLGVITGFTVRLDPLALGLGIGAYIRIRPAMGELRRVSALVAEIPEIVECDRVTGEDCFVAKAFVGHMEELESVIDRLLPHAQTNTSIIQSSPVKRRQPPFNGSAADSPKGLRSGRAATIDPPGTDS